MPNLPPKALLLASLASLAVCLCAAASLAGCAPNEDGAEASSRPSDPPPRSGREAGSEEGEPTVGTPGFPSTAKYFATFNFQASKAASGSALAYNASAIFTDRDPLAGTSCEAPEVVAGGCLARRCDVPSSAAPGVLAPIPAGDVSVETPSQQAKLTRNAQGFWTTTQKLAWEAGDGVTGTVTGAPAGAPAFTLTAPAPSAVTLTSPSIPAAFVPTPLKHPKSQDFVAKWSNGGAGNVRISIVGGAGGKVLHIQCEAPTSAKEVVVGASLLGRFDSARAQASLVASSHVTKRDGDWELAVFAHAPVLTPDGRDASMLVQFE